MIALVATGCSLFDPYPLPDGPGASQASPAAIGAPIQAVVLFMEIRPGDRIELLGADPVGVAAGADVRFFFSRPVVQTNGDRVIGDQLEPLVGATVAVDAGAAAGPENGVGIVAELTAHEPGVYDLTAVRLRYRLNGGGEQVRDGMSVLFRVCAAEVAPADCAPPE